MLTETMTPEEIFLELSQDAPGVRFFAQKAFGKAIREAAREAVRQGFPPRVYLDYEYTAPATGNVYSISCSFSGRPKNENDMQERIAITTALNTRDGKIHYFLETSNRNPIVTSFMPHFISRFKERRGMAAATTAADVIGLFMKEIGYGVGKAVVGQDINRHADKYQDREGIENRYVPVGDGIAFYDYSERETRDGKTFLQMVFQTFVGSGSIGGRQRETIARDRRDNAPRFGRLMQDRSVGIEGMIRYMIQNPVQKGRR